MIADLVLLIITIAITIAWTSFNCYWIGHQNSTNEHRREINQLHHQIDQLHHQIHYARLDAGINRDPAGKHLRAVNGGL